MKFIKKNQRLDYLLYMIERGRCQSLGQVASKFECSERTVKRMIYALKNEGHEIKYCRIKRCFFKENF